MNYKKLLELILENLDEGIIVTDNSAKITFYKEPAKNITGVDSKFVIGKNILDVFPNLNENTSTFYNVLKNKKPLINHIQHYVNYQGKNISILTSTIPIYEKGVLVGCFEIFKDLTEVMELTDKITTLQEKLFKGRQNEDEYKENGTKYVIENIIGVSEVISELKKKILMIANSSSSVLVYGETGTGKELLVQSIHNASSIRRNRPFIAQNCAAIPNNLLESILFGTEAGSFTGAKDKPGLFELADGGTLFLDEINSMDNELQAKLLRAIQDGVIRRVGSLKTRKVDVRIIASTNENPAILVERKQLRLDLYYRLNVIYFKIPPLRERKEDIEVLTDHFIRYYNKKLYKQFKGVSCEVMQLFKKYSWPGNIRELEHVIESAMNIACGDYITLNDLELSNTIDSININECCLTKNSFEIDLNEAVSEYEKNLIINAIRNCNGNYSMAARTLKIPKQTLQNKLKKYDISFDKIIRKIK
ncbi:transcriptional regulator [Fervidicella metallireducens AeB]|uniref:Transcriptional regulator n=1 Tax=Fervidicella metallireducens AeB TaxID=1403537 RepID=A0A017RUR1_9CLOT|nr:sigma-54-dependent Fis family transcriptional regulator [Fervidicella metallireducens]EYE88149.1 transcriptional regulator [Fervidicella metallireducens AeB]